MRGELIGVWSECWREVWLPLASEQGAPNDLYCEIYRELAPALKKQPKPEQLAAVIDDTVRSQEALERIQADELTGELELVKFFERLHDSLEELGGEGLANPYFNLLSGFIEKFSLRYDLRRPCILCPTLPGVFASLIRNLRKLAMQDPHLDGLMKDFESAIRDLRGDSSDGRIKTCIQKQVNLLEAIAKTCQGVTQGELGAMCNELGTWPHNAIKASLRNLYGFTSDYPGIRHGGNPQGVIRNIDMRDLIAMSILLAGFTPYLSDQFNAEGVYRGT